MEESNHQQRKVTHYRAIILATVVLALTTLSFRGGLDDFAQENVAKTITESIGIYATSRGLNATISTLQSSQIKAPLVASVQVGEVLDPINDAVERLSSVVVWAIGSLFLQRVVLEVAASNIFKWSFFVAGLMAISVLLLADWERVRNPFCEVLAISKASLARCRDLLIRIFIVAAIARFLVPAFVGISFLVSQILLEREFNESHENLSLLRTQVSTDTVMGSLDDQRLGEQKDERESELNNLQGSKASHLQEREALDQEIEKLEAGRDWWDWRSWVPESLGGASPVEELVSAKARRGEVDRELERIEQRIDDVRGDLECIDIRLAGESCDSWLNKLFSSGKAGYTYMTEMMDIREIRGKFDEIMTDIAKLLTFILVKNLLMPIVFLVIAVKCSMPIAKYSVRLSSTLKQDSKELRDSLQQTV